MATVTAGMTVSLDGYMNTAIEQTGAVVMGLRTFEMGEGGISLGHVRIGSAARCS